MGLSVPRHDKLQETIRSLFNNLTVFSWREYIVRPAPHVHKSTRAQVVDLLLPSLSDVLRLRAKAAAPGRLIASHFMARGLQGVSASEWLYAPCGWAWSDPTYVPGSYFASVQRP